MSKGAVIKRVAPPAAIPGGEISVDFETSNDARLSGALIGGAEAHVVAASGRRILALVPTEVEGGEAQVTLTFHDEPEASTPHQMVVGVRLAENVHPVANPAFDPAD